MLISTILSYYNIFFVILQTFYAIFFSNIPYIVDKFLLNTLYCV